VRTVNLYVAHGALAESRVAQVVKGGRNRTAECSGVWIRCNGTEIGVAFKACKSHLMAGQHPRIDRIVRIVTGDAPAEANRSVLERERTAQIAMTSKTPRFVGSKGLHRMSSLHALGEDSAVRIVAIRAGHLVLSKLVTEGAVELGPIIRVTCCAIK
jgi:hypothetical protein